MSLSNTILGDKIIINDKEKEYTTFFECIIEERNILFQNIFEYNNEVYLNIDSIYNFTIFTNIGQIKGSFKIISYIKEGRRKFYLAEVNETTMNENQYISNKEIKFSCNLPYSINIIDDNKNKTKIDCIIKEISIEGIRFLTNYFLEKNIDIEIELVTSEDFFYGIGRIEKYQNYPKSNYKNQYIIKFFKVNFSNEDFLKRYFENKK